MKHIVQFTPDVIRQLTPPEFYLLGHLALAADAQTGVTTVSSRALAREASGNRADITKRIRRLVELGYLEIVSIGTSVGHAASQYRVLGMTSKHAK